MIAARVLVLGAFLSLMTCALSAEVLPRLLAEQKRAKRMEDRIFFEAVKSATKEEIDTSRNAAGETALHITTRRGFPNEVLMLLQHGADPNVRDDLGQTPLHLAAKMNHEVGWMTRDYLAVASAEIDARDDAGFTPLMYAAQAGNSSTVEFLVWLGAALNPYPEAPARSPLALAQAAGETDTAALLEELQTLPPITLGQTPTVVPKFIQRAFVEAAAMADFAKLETLLQQGAQVDGKDEGGATALHRAVSRSHEDVVTYLVLLGADANITDQNGNNAFMRGAGWFGISKDRVRGVLVLAGTRADCVNVKGYTTLTENLRRLNTHGAQWAIFLGADVNAPTPKGTPMRVACEAKDQRLIDLLRSNGVTEPEWVDPDRVWQLESAIRRDQRDKVMEMVGAGAELNQLTQEGETMLNAAIHTRLIGMADLLISLGADPAMKSKEGHDTLRATCVWNFGAVNELRARLLENGAVINSRASDGTTPLMRAVHYGYQWVGVTQLVDAGADLELRDNQGRTALAHALASGRTAAAEYLITRGAKTEHVAQEQLAVLSKAPLAK